MREAICVRGMLVCDVFAWLNLTANKVSTIVCVRVELLGIEIRVQMCCRVSNAQLVVANGRIVVVLSKHR
jgi:hypothetical protein